MVEARSSTSKRSVSQNGSLTSMFYGSEIKAVMPKLHSENFEGLELIPLYLVKKKVLFLGVNIMI